MVRTDGEAQLRSVLGALDENRRADNRQPFPQKVGVLPLKQRKGGRRPASPPTASSPSECRTRSAQLLSSSTIQGPAFREGSASPDAWCSSPDDSARNRYQTLQRDVDVLVHEVMQVASAGTIAGLAADGKARLTVEQVHTKAAAAASAKEVRNRQRLNNSATAAVNRVLVESSQRERTLQARIKQLEINASAVAEEEAAAEAVAAAVAAARELEASVTDQEVTDEVVALNVLLEKDSCELLSGGPTEANGEIVTCGRCGISLCGGRQIEVMGRSDTGAFLVDSPAHSQRRKATAQAVAVQFASLQDHARRLESLNADLEVKIKEVIHSSQQSSKLGHATDSSGSPRAEEDAARAAAAAVVVAAVREEELCDRLSESSARLREASGREVALLRDVETLQGQLKDAVESAGNAVDGREAKKAELVALEHHVLLLQADLKEQSKLAQELKANRETEREREQSSSSGGGGTKEQQGAAILALEAERDALKDEALSLRSLAALKTDEADAALKLLESEVALSEESSDLARRENAQHRERVKAAQEEKERLLRRLQKHSFRDSQVSKDLQSMVASQSDHLQLACVKMQTMQLDQSRRAEAAAGTSERVGHILAQLQSDAGSSAATLGEQRRQLLKVTSDLQFALKDLSEAKSDLADTSQAANTAEEASLLNVANLRTSHEEEVTQLREGLAAAEQLAYRMREERDGLKVQQALAREEEEEALQEQLKDAFVESEALLADRLAELDEWRERAVAAGEDLAVARRSALDADNDRKVNEQELRSTELLLAGKREAIEQLRADLGAATHRATKAEGRLEILQHKMEMKISKFSKFNALLQTSQGGN